MRASRTATEAAHTAPSHEQLDEEWQALRRGIDDLNSRIESHNAGIRLVENDARQKIAPVAKLLVNALVADAKEA